MPTSFEWLIGFSCFGLLALLYLLYQLIEITEKIEGLTPEELAEFIEIIKPYPIIYNPIMVMLNTGMRTQEVIGLKWRDIDFQNDRLFVRQAVTMAVEFDEDGKIKNRKSIVGDTKTEGSNREIGLTPEAKEILLTWREEAPSISKTKLGDDDFVFGYEKKPSFTYCAFRDRVNDYLIRQAGSIDKMRLHRFRHTVGTLLAAEALTSPFSVKILCLFCHYNVPKVCPYSRIRRSCL